MKRPKEDRRDKPIRRELDRLIGDLPLAALREILPEKLKAEGVEPRPDLVEALATHLVSGRGNRFSWEDGDDSDPPRDLKLTFTDEDAAKLDAIIERFGEQFPAVLEDTTKRSAYQLLDALQSRWPDERQLQLEEDRGFRERLEKRWGAAFEGMRMLVTMCRETGGEAHDERLPIKDRTLRSVMIRLHARGCQIACETLALMEAGYADGAMARWRTLYEVTTVATLIAEWGSQAAERYIAHEIVESKRAMEEFEKCAPSLGQRQMSAREKRSVLKQYDRAIAKYGKEFGTPNGWASAFMTNKKPKFNHLEEAAQQAWMRSYYKIASYPVHAGIKGILFRLGTLDDRRTILAGASNAGFADPLERVSVSLVQLTMLLLRPDETVDDLIILRCFVDLRDQIIRDALDAHHALVRDDLAYRASLAKLAKPRARRSPVRKKR